MSFHKSYGTIGIVPVSQNTLSSVQCTCTFYPPLSSPREKPVTHVVVILSHPSYISLGHRLAERLNLLLLLE